MKIKSQPRQTNFGNNLDYALLQGLSEAGKNWAKTQVKKHKFDGVAVPYGLIRLIALKK